MTKLTANDWLPWLADAPMFIDEMQVASLYDAIVQPEFETTEVSMKAGEVAQLSTKYSLGAEVDLGLGGFLLRLFPSLKLKGGAEVERSGEESSETTVILNPVSNPYRRLLHLALHYLANHPDRIFASDDQLDDFADSAQALATPRGLVVLDIQPGALILPTAAETKSGKVELLYPRGDDAPTYPTSAASPEELRPARVEYWKAIMGDFSAQEAMVAIEEAAVEANRFEWVDYRLALWRDEVPVDTAHLHIQGRCKYSTGTFAYNLVKRGVKHGLRVVGVLKSEPDINVLAIFER